MEASSASVSRRSGSTFGRQSASRASTVSGCCWGSGGVGGRCRGGTAPCGRTRARSRSAASLARSQPRVPGTRRPRAGPLATTNSLALVVRRSPQRASTLTRTRKCCDDPLNLGSTHWSTTPTVDRVVRAEQQERAPCVKNRSRSARSSCLSSASQPSTTTGRRLTPTSWPAPATLTPWIGYATKPWRQYERSSPPHESGKPEFRIGDHAGGQARPPSTLMMAPVV